MNSQDLGNNDQKIISQPQIANQKNNVNSGPKRRGRKKKVPLLPDDDDNKSSNPMNKDISNVISEFEEEDIDDKDSDDIFNPDVNDNNNTSLAPKKRGRKKKVIPPEEGETNINTPKKRGRKKKIKDNNSDDLDYIPPNSDSNNNDNNNSTNDSQNINVEIKNGINDLTNLPIELLRMELVQRGYHEGVINRLDKWYLVSMLRETAYNHFNYFSFCSRYGLNSWERNDGPMEKIFENDPETEKKRLEEQRLKKEEREKEEENGFDDTSIDPNEFSKEKIKKNSGKLKRMYDFF